MSSNDIARLTKAAAQYMQKQHGDDAILEARVGKRYAEVMGDQDAVEAFNAILDYLEAHPSGDEKGERDRPWKSMGDA
ncbi:hypothetical protein GCM10011390_10500 [Aureimonas endophytica]|uniref:Uncharacterized protein n=1 Tax=Aureimonas endophytica TaxID=2027858 RepID=A0A916ZF33_9HYPH|nr:hypothetical protein GCM10011390_10500 [Aureimonas endophytica]